MSEDGERLIDEKEFEEQERNLRKEASNFFKCRVEFPNIKVFMSQCYISFNRLLTNLQEKKAAKRKFGEDEEYAANVREERKEYKLALKKKIRLEKERQVILRNN